MEISSVNNNRCMLLSHIDTSVLRSTIKHKDVFMHDRLRSHSGVRSPGSAETRSDCDNTATVNRKTHTERSQRKVPIGFTCRAPFACRRETRRSIVCPDLAIAHVQIRCRCAPVKLHQ